MSEATYREAYDYEPDRDAQGEGIAWLKAHASAEITREDQASMNCGIFIDLLDAINYISDIEEINTNRAYVALCVKGRNRCYHEMQTNQGDVFVDIAEYVSKGKRALDSPSKRAIARDTFTIFNDVKSTKFHTDRQTLKIAVDESKKCGVKTSQLNLYWCMVGLKYIIEDESMYQQYADKPLFEDALRPLWKADKILEERRGMLQAWMAI